MSCRAGADNDDAKVERLFLALPRPKLLQKMTLKLGPAWGRRKISVCPAGALLLMTMMPKSGRLFLALPRLKLLQKMTLKFLSFGVLGEA